MVNYPGAPVEIYKFYIIPMPPGDRHMRLLHFSGIFTGINALSSFLFAPLLKNKI
jgi:hypothetical protein